MANLLSTNVSGRLYVSDFSDTNSSYGAFRFYDGSTFRGGLGLDDWAHGGSAANITMYVNGDNNFFISTSGVKRAQFNSGAAIFRTYSADTNYSIRIYGGDAIGAFYNDNATTLYVNWNGGETRFGNTIRTNGYLYTNYEIRVGEIWGHGGLYRSSGHMMFGTEGGHWYFQSQNNTRAQISQSDGNIWMSWANDWLSNLLSAKASTSSVININAEYSGYISEEGWHTIASYGSGRALGTFHIYDTDSSRHNYVEAKITWSYGNGGIHIVNNGRHGASTIRHIRLLFNTSDQTYGGVKVQVYCENPAWTLKIRQEYPNDIGGWGSFNQVTPVLQNDVESFGEYSVAYRVNDNGTMTTSAGAGYLAGNAIIHEGGADQVKSGYLQSNSSLRAPIFYDSNNTSYYLDPSSNTSLRTVGSWRADSSTWDGEYSGKIQYHSNHWYFQSGDLWIFRNAGGSNVVTINQSGQITSSNILAPIFYDSADTSYYVDPNSYSRIYRTSTHLAPSPGLGTSNWVSDFNATPTSSMSFGGDLSSGGPQGTWWFQQNFRHSNSSNYWGTQVAWGWEDNANELWQRNVTGGNWSGWVRYINTNNYAGILDSRYQQSSTAITTSNIGSQSVNYANYAGYSIYAQRIDSPSQNGFTVGGDPNQFYPVVFAVAGGATHNQIGTFVIERGGYEDPGYSNFGFTTMHLQMTMKPSGWGYGADFVNFDSYRRTQNMVANMATIYQSSHLILWLRGGTYYRWFNVRGATSLVFGNPDGTNYTETSLPYYDLTYEPADTIQSKFSEYVAIEHGSKWFGANLYVNNNITAANAIYAPIFYDSDDNGYYVDPNGTSRLNYVNAPQGYVSIGNPWGTANSAYFPNGITTAGNDNWIYGHTYIGNAPSNGNGHEFWTNGNSYSTGDVSAGGSFRAPIFYDSQDTNYYVDPNGTSVLNVLEVGNGVDGNQRIVLKTGNDTGTYTAIRLQYGGVEKNTIHFFNDTWQSGTLAGHSTGAINLSGKNGVTFGGWNAPSMWVDNNGVAQVTDSFRAPIFYDSNDTSYYVDPNGISVLAGFNLNTAGTAKFRYLAPGEGTVNISAPFAFNSGTGAINIAMTDNDTGGVVIDNEGVTVYGAGDTGAIFRAIDEDVWQTNGNDVDAATTFRVLQGASAGTFTRGTVTTDSGIKSNVYYDYGGSLLFQSGSTSGTTRHLNLSSSTVDPSNNFNDVGVGITWGQRTDSSPYYLIHSRYYTNDRTTHSRLTLGWHTGIDIGADPYYGGTRFYNQSPGVGGGVIMSVGNVDNHVRIAERLYTGGAIQSAGGIIAESGTQITLDQNYAVHGYLQYSAATFGGETAFGMYGYYGISFNTRQGVGIAVRGDSGKVGIGTNEPAEKLQVSGNISVTSGTGTKIGFNTTDSFTGYGYSVAYYGISYPYGQAAVPLALSGYYGLGLFTDGTERIRINQNGTVGIGTASPSANLHVVGSLYSTTTISTDSYFKGKYTYRNNPTAGLPGQSNPVKTASGVLATYSDNGGSYQYIVIKTRIPQDWYQMGGFTIDLFADYYNSNKKTTISLGGYWNPESNNGFEGFEYNTTNPNVRPTIEVMRDITDGMTCFVIHNMTWSYPVVVARDLYLGYNSNDIEGGLDWSIFGADDLGGYTNNDPVHCRNAVPADQWYGNTYIHYDGRHYGTIFYDSNDSAYYCDPNGTSRLYVINDNGGETYGVKYFYSNKGNGVYLGSTNTPSLQAYSTDGSAAFMTFHRSNSYAVNFGLDPDNVIRLGGWSASANRMQLDMSGNVTFAGDVTAYSDARIKTNVQTIENALDKTLKLRGVTYNRTDSEDTSTKVGVIAQEILEVIPEVVNQDASGMYNVSYGNLTAVLIEAIKEQQKQIDELKEIINGLTK